MKLIDKYNLQKKYRVIGILYHRFCSEHNTSQDYKVLEFLKDHYKLQFFNISDDIDYKKIKEIEYEDFEKQITIFLLQ